MRARTNAPSYRVDASQSNDVVNISQNTEEDCNGKDKPITKKFKHPPMASFKMPPPPKISLRSESTAENKENDTDTRNDTGENDDSEKFTGESAKPLSAPTLELPIPPSQSVQESAVYQRPLARNIQTLDNATTDNTNRIATCSANGGAYPTPQTQQQYQPSSVQISHPYKPSSWYADARNVKRRREILYQVLGVAFVFFMLVSFYMKKDTVDQYLESIETPKKFKRQYKNYHHHDHDKKQQQQPDRKQFHPMMGINEAPMGFAKVKEETSTIIKKKSYRESEQEHSNSASNDVSSSGLGESESGLDLFSTFPVTTLSNKRLLPKVGFGVSSRSVEHKQIPIVVATLLQYASSETEGGGGIAMIDAVIDPDRELENDGGPMQYSISNKVAERYEDKEEQLESNMAKTVVTLVGRAISYFGKEHARQYKSPSSSTLPIDDRNGYDYEHRVEVHLLVGLSGPDLGSDNTVKALQYFTAELDGIVPAFPKDVLYTDLSTWKPQISPTAVDHKVDVRMHVLLRLNHCHDKTTQHVGACSSDVKTNKELLDRFMESYNILEKLYEAKIIHGIGLDGIHAGDIQFLINKCKIKPQVYRGDVYQALDIYARGRIDKEEHIAKVLKDNNITFLASNVGGHIIQMKAMTPNAYALLQHLGSVLFHAHLAQGHIANVEGDAFYTVARIVLAYLVRHKACVLPHAVKAEHLADDSPESVGGLATFLTERRVAEIGAAMKALLSENDLPEDHGLGMEGEKEVAVVFHNYLADDAHIFRIMKNIGGGNGGEREVAIPPERGGVVKGGDSVTIISNHGDKFASSVNGNRHDTYVIKTDPGGATDFTIGL